MIHLFLEVEQNAVHIIIGAHLKLLCGFLGYPHQLVRSQLCLNGDIVIFHQGFCLPLGVSDNRLIFLLRFRDNPFSLVFNPLGLLNFIRQLQPDFPYDFQKFLRIDHDFSCQRKS